MDPNTWIEEQRAYQRETFGLDPDTAGMLYFRDMALALFVEVGELVQALPGWKPWGGGQLPTPEETARGVEELIDVLFFAANLAAWLGLSTEGVWAAYQDKLAVNIARQKGRVRDGLDVGWPETEA